MKIKLILITAIIFILMAALVSASDIIAKAGNFYVAGNTGIGTNNPTSLLSVQGAAVASSPGASFITLTNTHGTAADQFGILFNNTGYAGSARINSYLDAGGATSRLQFLTGGATPTVAMTIDGSGNTGIGANPNSDNRLYVSGSTYGIYGEGQTYGVKGYDSTSGRIGILGYDSMGVYGAGYIGVRAVGDGTGSGYAVYGDNAYIGVYGDGGTCDFYANGGPTYYCTSSSIKWKKNIRNLTNSLEKITSLRGVMFDYDEAHGSSNNSIGMIAEEVAKVYPEIVAYKDGDVYGMDYTLLIPPLVNSIKEQQKEIDLLKAIVCKDHPEEEICS